MIVRTRSAARLVLPVAMTLSLVGCGASAGSRAPSAPAAVPDATSLATQPAASPPAATQPAASQPDAVASGDDQNAIGDNSGDRSKGSAQAQVTGGVTSSIDLPFSPTSQFLANGPGTAYLAFTDPTHGTLFLTIADNGLLVQYAGPDDVALTNGPTPCELHVDSLDGGGAKGSFSCKGMLLVHGESLGNADMSGTFEGHR